MLSKGNQEARLEEFLSANAEEKRSLWAQRWKREGKKVIGLLSDCIPEELVAAAGMVPWRITGTWQAEVERATVYRPLYTDLYASHVAEALLSGELDFLDGVIVAHLDDDQRRLWDLWVHLGRSGLAHYLYIPRKQKEYAIVEFASGLERLALRLGEFSGQPVTETSLQEAIEVYNRWRKQLQEVYVWRKQPVPPLSGRDYLRLTTASFVMPKAYFTQELETHLPYLQQRHPSLPHSNPRILVTSDNLDHPGYLEVLEGAGCLVAMDDLDTGSRYFWGLVENTGNPYYHLARRYLTKPGDPRMFDWKKVADGIIAWAHEFDVDGVINFPAMYAYWRELFSPYLEQRMKQAGIPVMTLGREYHLANVAQLKTRMETFVEILEGVGD